MDLSNVNTEKINEDTKNIDELGLSEVLKKINEQDQLVASRVYGEIETITKVADKMVNAIESDGRIIYVGAGTSGRLGFLDAAECPPTYGVPEEVFVSLIAGGEEAMKRAIEGAEDSDIQGCDDLLSLEVKPNDVVIGIAASGRTQYAIGALKKANEIGCYTAAITASKNSKMKNYVVDCIEVNVGPEVISGSTRMKAGTAQKLVLNMLSTSTMIKSGRVYDNLMIDVQPTNEKLRQRAVLIVERALDIDEETATQLLNEANGVIRYAIIMYKLNVDIGLSSIQ